MNVQDFIAITNFLGDDITEEQVLRLMDEARELSIADRELLYNVIDNEAFYTELSIHNAEMGRLYRY